MNTVRFSKVMETCGRPDIHLLLIEPDKDKALQAAIRADRVMTVYQAPGGGKSDYGIIGFEEGRSRQYLVFPKPLKPFAENRVVGIKYDLLEPEADVPAETSTAAAPQQPPGSPTGKATSKTSDQPDKKAPTLSVTSQSPPALFPKPASMHRSRSKKSSIAAEADRQTSSERKLVDFPQAEQIEASSTGSDQVNRIKGRIRKAMDLLEEGKQVAAFNVLKEILGE